MKRLPVPLPGAMLPPIQVVRVSVFLVMSPGARRVPLVLPLMKEAARRVVMLPVTSPGVVVMVMAEVLVVL